MAAPQPPIYTGLLDYGPPLFPGQSRVDLHFTDFSNAGPKVKHRQRTVCFDMGFSFAFPESTIGPEGSWKYNPILLPFMEFMDHGPVEAPGAGVQVPCTGVAIGQETILGYEIPQFHHITERWSLAPGHIWYYEHTKHDGSDPHSTPTMIEGVEPKVCNSIVYGTEVGTYIGVR
ncbi:hypothetical protein DFP72DRAFT_597127 [Ephemerocybe angulata]|uniref:Uncharacterized protein n=1 Tax=Ephemerocybe angulata TaxID=980116 RepID=A0A8H6IAV9_9AGAR|nr:hypothetical protein DFP72DRAFT_597127 [Tulosesus angulatus]